MKKLESKWESEQPVPDEDLLKKQWEAELRNLDASLGHEEKSSERRKANLDPLVKASKLDPDAKAKESKRLSRETFERAQAMIAEPPIDFESLHQQELEVAKQTAGRKEGPGNPYWWGYIWSPSYAGWWSSWDGEAQEVPNISLDTVNNRFDPRTQAWGSGWWEGDFSELHGYLAFGFRPPSWGHLHVYVYPWLHGYYSLYSNDEWYTSEYARAEVDTWMDLHQNFWRSRAYQRRFTLSGDELNPTRYGRIDSQYSQVFFADVGEGDYTTIRAGARLYSGARAGGSHSILNFQAGTGNYIYAPYIYWYLHQ